MSRFQDVVIDDKGKTYRSCLDQANQMIIFRENALIWEELSQIFLGSDFLPYFDKYSIGNGCGLIAYYKNLISPVPLRPKIDVFDFSLNFTKTITISHKCRSGFPHVLPNDNILFLTDDGFLSIYFADRLIFQYDFSTLIKSPPCIVMSASFYLYSGIILLATGELIDFYFDELQTSSSKTFKFLRNPTIISTLSGIEKPRSMQFIPFDKSPINDTFALIIDQDGCIITAGKQSFFKVKLDSDVSHAAFSASFNKLALYHSEGNITITTPTLSEIIEEYPVDTDIFVDCLSLSWVGDVIPIGIFDGGVVLLSDDQGSVWYIEGQSLAITEPDSAVILTSKNIYRLSSVSKTNSNNQIEHNSINNSIISIDLIPPNDPKIHINNNDIKSNWAINDNVDMLGALGLLDSPSKLLCQIFDQRSLEPPIDRLSHIDLQRAVRGCCLAALFVKALDAREFYLNAAVYGLKSMPLIKNQHDSHNSSISEINSFVTSTINRVRLFENLHQISMPITSFQLDYLSISDLFSRLSQRRYFDLAFSITDKLYNFQFLMKDPKSKIQLNLEDIERIQNETYREIASSLAEYVISSTSNDQECMSKLAEYQRIEYDKACHIAQLAKRSELSKMLAERETRCSRKALCFSEIQQWTDALKYSIYSCDSSILLAVISSFISSDDQTFYEKIVSNTPAFAFSLRFPDLLTSERKQKALKSVQSGNDSVDPAMRNLLNERGNAPSMTVLAPFEQLEALQKKAVNRGADPSIIGMPLNKTIRTLLSSGYEEEAVAIQKACEVKKGKMDALRIQAFVKSGFWNKMTQFAVQNKKRTLWPYLIDLHLQGNVKHLNVLLEEIAVVDPKIKASFAVDIESNKFDPSNLKDRPAILALFS